MSLRVLLIGASGVFGSRVARQLAGDPRFRLTLAGRQLASLATLRESLGDPSVQLAALDVAAAGLAEALAAQAARHEVVGADDIGQAVRTQHWCGSVHRLHGGGQRAPGVVAEQIGEQGEGGHGSMMRGWRQAGQAFEQKKTRHVGGFSLRHRCRRCTVAGATAIPAFAGMTF
ncbi:hypothetical protein [Rhodanobacter sp. Soil772]|jgi:hypothetical protein|uniref:hypothetical protein n=1 Tax=Rhodanobacter sp. Soil772 TaxID=1736406 RepID=UPI000ABD7874|nr:hypothetical protein [Rhodanobacter sp. Soil772]